MRFFSNEAKDNVDDQDPGDRTTQERTEPAVPQQRAGSPWADSADRPVVHEPAPQPTAFGASTVGGAVAASAVAGPHDTDGRHTDRTTDAASGIADDRTVVLDSRPEQAEDQDKTVLLGTRSDDAETGRHAQDGPVEDRGTFDDPRVAGDPKHDDVLDLPLEDKHEALEDKHEEPASPADRDDVVDAAVKDEGTFDDPQVVTATDQAKQPAAPAVTGPAPFFPTGETETLRNRWRDVQLRFVDDPKAATGEAAALVDEAVDKLTTALREHRGSLSKGTDDTESLRVELRSYRDILDRLLGL